MKNNIKCIYQITNIKNKKKYIGSTNDFKRRKYEHFNLLELNQHRNKILQADFNKYNRKFFRMKILEILPDSINEYDLRYKEMFYIFKYQPEYNKGLPALPEKNYTQNDINKVYQVINL